MTTDDAAAIQLQGLRKTFGDLVAVADVRLAVRRGETFGLLGPNGAGKSTTMHMIVGLLRPDAGEIFIDAARDPTRAEVRRRLGLAPQSLALYDRLTAEENLRLFGRTYGLHGPQLRERVAWGLAFAGLTDRRRGRVGTFSGGMKRRLNLAAALLHDPPVVLCDEPTVGVDPQSRNRIFENLEELKAAGRTIVYTTHYMEEAERLCDRIAIMDHGRVLALDTSENLVREHGGEATIIAQLAAPPKDGAVLPGHLDGNELRIQTRDPLAELGRLVSAGVALTGLHMERPDLEDVFLALTGRRLRD